MRAEGKYSRKLKVLDRIQSTMAADIEEMNEIIRTSLHTNHALVNSIVDNYLKTKGKQIRPILVMLSARMFGGIDRKVLYCAASLEMLHNATLIHDDVIDQTLLRRNEETVNAVWGNHIAVLVGDLFVSRALETGVKSGNLDVVHTISDMGAELSLGEIDQAFIARSHILSEESYFGMIDRKTASLFKGCIKMGAQALDVPEEDYKPLEIFAGLMGEAFQIRDDIFDYFSSEEIGKPAAHDLMEGKVTLPLLYALEHGDKDEREKMRKMLMSEEELTAAEIETLQKFAIAGGGIDYAYRKMMELREEALGYLRKYPVSESRDDFEDIFQYIIERTH